MGPTALLTMMLVLVFVKTMCSKCYWCSTSELSCLHNWEPIASVSKQRQPQVRPWLRSVFETYRLQQAAQGLPMTESWLKQRERWSTAQLVRLTPHTASGFLEGLNSVEQVPRARSQANSRLPTTKREVSNTFAKSDSTFSVEKVSYFDRQVKPKQHSEKKYTGHQTTTNSTPSSKLLSPRRRKQGEPEAT